jgi:DNA-binding protein WhiA
MSFSSETKEELMRLPLEGDCCVMAELSALTQTAGSLSLAGGGRLRISWQVENAALARRIYRMLKDRLGLSPHLHFVEHRRLGGRRTCVLTLGEEETPGLLVRLRMMELDEAGRPVLRRTLPRPVITRQCCRRAYVRGAFLGAGSITNPDRAYHFEITARDDGLRELLEKQLERSGLQAKHTLRRGVPVVYLKGAQEIADVLALMEAPQAVMRLENTRITRQMRGAANRGSNCDEHNSERQLDAAKNQEEAIRLLAIHAGLYTLPPALRAMAEARLEHPDLSLEQLGQVLDPPLSKSGAASRMRRLMQEARQLRAELERTLPKRNE